MEREVEQETIEQGGCDSTRDNAYYENDRYYQSNNSVT